MVLAADDGTPVPVFLTDDMELWCNHQGQVTSCVLEFVGYKTIITTDPFRDDGRGNTQIEHEMQHINGAMYEKDIKTASQPDWWIPDYMRQRNQ